MTSDNPRSEDPAAIANAVARGVRDEGNRRWTIEIDRRAAIAPRDRRARRRATSCSSPARATRPTRSASGVRTPFSDAAEADAALSAWSAA